MCSFFMQSYGQSERLVKGFCNKSRREGGREVKQENKKAWDSASHSGEHIGKCWWSSLSPTWSCLPLIPKRQTSQTAFPDYADTGSESLGCNYRSIKTRMQSIRATPHSKPTVATPKLGMANASAECLLSNCNTARKRPNLQQFYSFTVIKKMNKVYDAIYLPIPLLNYDDSTWIVFGWTREKEMWRSFQC